MTKLKKKEHPTKEEVLKTKSIQTSASVSLIGKTRVQKKRRSKSESPVAAKSARISNKRKKDKLKIKSSTLEKGGGEKCAPIQLTSNSFNKEQIKSGVSALLDLIKVTGNAKTNLLDVEQPLFLQICCVKVPKVPPRIIRLSLLHSILTDESEICLIASDLKDMNHKEHEEAVDYYQKFLRSKGINNIKTILPLHQVRTEYDQFELKRRLVELYDAFLVEGKISGRVVHMLGKIFYDRRKIPTPVRLSIPNLKSHFDAALSKVSMEIHPNGDTFIIQVGHTKMSAQQNYENVVSVINNLAREFPGGLENIRALYVKTDLSAAIPIYLTMKRNSEVNVPVQKSARPRAYTTVGGELTTYTNAEVTVHPSGKVRVKSKKNEGSDDEDLGPDDDTRFEEPKKTKSAKKTKKSDVNLKKDQIKEKPKKKIMVHDNEGLTKEEQAYLIEYAQQIKKIKKVVKNKTETTQKNVKENKAVKTNKALKTKNVNEIAVVQEKEPRKVAVLKNKRLNNVNVGQENKHIKTNVKPKVLISGNALKPNKVSSKIKRTKKIDLPTKLMSKLENIRPQEQQLKKKINPGKVVKTLPTKQKTLKHKKLQNQGIDLNKGDGDAKNKKGAKKSAIVVETLYLQESGSGEPHIVIKQKKKQTPVVKKDVELAEKKNANKRKTNDNELSTPIPKKKKKAFKDEDNKVVRTKEIVMQDSVEEFGKFGWKIKLKQKKGKGKGNKNKSDSPSSGKSVKKNKSKVLQKT